MSDNNSETDEESLAQREYIVDKSEAAKFEEIEPVWLEMWRKRDFAWKGRSEGAALQAEMIEVPASFSDGKDCDGDCERVSLRDYWRSSIGLPGEVRLLSDQELKDSGLLVEVEGEIYHLVHAPDITLKLDDSGAPLLVLRDIIAARARMASESIGLADNANLNFRRVLQLSGSWLPGELLKDVAEGVALDISSARLFSVDLSGRKLGHSTFEGSLFSGNACFTGATFAGKANFEHAAFERKATFIQATFAEGGNFRQSTFCGEAHFDETSFNHEAMFEGAAFRGSADFFGAAFAECADFSKCTFSDGVNFLSVRFAGRAEFSAATVSGVATFGPSFNGPANFRGAKFKGIADFTGATFNREVSFKDAYFTKKANFQSGTFGEIASFEGVTFSDEPSFSDATFKSRCTFSAGNWPAGAIDKAFYGTRFQLDAWFGGFEADAERIASLYDDADLTWLRQEIRSFVIQNASANGGMTALHERILADEAAAAARRSEEDRRDAAEKEAQESRRRDHRRFGQLALAVAPIAVVVLAISGSPSMRGYIKAKIAYEIKKIECAAVDSQLSRTRDQEPLTNAALYAELSEAKREVERLQSNYEVKLAETIDEIKDTATSRIALTYEYKGDDSYEVVLANGSEYTILGFDLVDIRGFQEERPVNLMVRVDASSTLQFASLDGGHVERSEPVILPGRLSEGHIIRAETFRDSSEFAQAKKDGWQISGSGKYAHPLVDRFEVDTEQMADLLRVVSKPQDGLDGDLMASPVDWVALADGQLIAEREALDDQAQKFRKLEMGIESSEAKQRISSLESDVGMCEAERDDLKRDAVWKQFL